MDASSLIPSTESIPAPAWLFVVLKILTFSIHLLFINVVLGGSLIILFYRFKDDTLSLQTSFHGAAAGKIPTLIALGVNFGVAPLLFVQVLYGHLFYSSSVLMAAYWIMIIPILILAYYGAYIHIKKYESSKALSKFVLLLTVLFVLYIGFMFVNNSTLALQPEKWNAYFQGAGGGILNLGDPTIIPRYLHFVAASVAIGGLFLAIIWHLRKGRGVADAEPKIQTALKIFGLGTAVQMAVGFWFLIALPSDFILQFMGRDVFATAMLFFAILMAIGALVSAFLNKLLPTLIHTILTILAMVITRQNVRDMYLSDKFSPKSLALSPQYDVLSLFLVIFVIGLIAVWWMIKACRPFGLKGGTQ